MDGATKPIIGKYTDQLHNDIMRLGEMRDEAERDDVLMRKNRNYHLILHKFIAAAGLIGTIVFSNSKNSDTPWGSALLITSIFATTAAVVCGEFQKTRFANTPTPAYDQSRLLDLTIYDQTKRHPALFEEGGIFKYPETPKKWQYMKDNNLQIKPA